MCLLVIDEGYPYSVGCPAGEDPVSVYTMRVGLAGRLAFYLWAVFPCPPTAALAFTQRFSYDEWKADNRRRWKEAFPA